MAPRKRAPRRKCLVYRDERQLADLVADDEITTEDADAVREFARFLEAHRRRDERAGGE